MKNFVMLVSALVGFCSAQNALAALWNFPNITNSTDCAAYSNGGARKNCKWNDGTTATFNSAGGIGISSDGALKPGCNCVVPDLKAAGASVGSNTLSGPQTDPNVGKAFPISQISGNLGANGGIGSLKNDPKRVQYEFVNALNFNTLGEKYYKIIKVVGAAVNHN